MAALYGRLQGSRGQATRCGTDVIRTTVETWEGQVTVILERDGTFSVGLGQKGSYGRTIVSGNVNDQSANVEGITV